MIIFARLTTWEANCELDTIQRMQQNNVKKSGVYDLINYPKNVSQIFSPCSGNKQ